MATPKKLNPRDELYKRLPDALEVITKSMADGGKHPPHQSAVYSAWKLMNKLCPDMKAVEIEGDITIKQQDFILGNKGTA